MGKKAPSATPIVPKPSKKKAPAVLTTAAVEPPAVEVTNLHAATQLLDNMPADVLLAYAKAKAAAESDDDSDGDWEAKLKPRERLVQLRTDVQARDSQIMRSYAEQIEQVVDGSITSRKPSFAPSRRRSRSRNSQSKPSPSNSSDSRATQSRSRRRARLRAAPLTPRMTSGRRDDFNSCCPSSNQKN